MSTVATTHPLLLTTALQKSLKLTSSSQAQTAGLLAPNIMHPDCLLLQKHGISSPRLAKMDDETALICGYMFLGFNTMMGLYIFVFHCIQNEKVGNILISLGNIPYILKIYGIHSRCGPILAYYLF